MDRIDLLDNLQDISSNLDGVISIIRLCLNDLHNPNGSLPSNDLEKAIIAIIELLLNRSKEINAIVEEVKTKGIID